MHGYLLQLRTKVQSHGHAPALQRVHERLPVRIVLPFEDPIVPRGIVPRAPVAAVAHDIPAALAALAAAADAVGRRRVPLHTRPIPNEHAGHRDLVFEQYPARASDGRRAPPHPREHAVSLRPSRQRSGTSRERRVELARVQERVAREERPPKLVARGSDRVPVIVGEVEHCRLDVVQVERGAVRIHEVGDCGRIYRALGRVSHCGGSSPSSVAVAGGNGMTDGDLGALEVGIAEPRPEAVERLATLAPDEDLRTVRREVEQLLPCLVLRRVLLDVVPTLDP
mmetsp:Transcript_4855/g.12187  ORF Transcript_4855/g.12187 Transcript_4855/m.12187 type:complete len:282 (-) Transcript_4855:1811-2656(-)